jgi:hypothetical protein
MNVSDIFDVQQPSSFSTDLTLNSQKYHVEVVVERSENGKNWQCEVHISGNALVTKQKTEPVALGMLQNMAVIGFCLNPNYHRPNEQIVDLATFLDKETVESIKKNGENTVCTIRQSGKSLKFKLEDSVSGQLKPTK